MSAPAPYIEPVVAWSIFDSYVLPQVKGCPAQVAEDHYRRASRTFFAKTRAWQIRAPMAEAVAGAGTYPLAILNAERVKLNGATADGVDYPTNDVMRGRELIRDGSSTQEVFNDDAKNFTVNGTDALDIVTLDLVLKPSLDSVGFPSRFDGLVDDIAHGAIASLLRMTRQEWTDLTTSAIEQVMFEERIAVVGYNVRRGFRSGRKPASRML